MLTGKKTYLVAGITTLTTILTALSGQISYPEAAQLIVTAVMGATIRNGITTEAKK